MRSCLIPSISYLYEELSPILQSKIARLAGSRMLNTVILNAVSAWSISYGSMEEGRWTNGQTGGWRIYRGTTGGKENPGGRAEIFLLPSCTQPSSRPTDSRLPSGLHCDEVLLCLRESAWSLESAPRRLPRPLPLASSPVFRG